MAPTQNKGLILASIPSGFPTPGVEIQIQDRPIDLQQNLPPNTLLVKNHHVSFDPFQRGRMRPASVKSYSPAYELNAPLQNSTVSTVINSSSSKFQKHDLVLVSYNGGTEEYTLVPPDLLPNVSKLDNPHGIDERHFLGALGMPGLTAYSSFYEIGRPKRGETLFVSSASGAVGSLVGQLALHEGLTVIGSVGTDEKLAYITQTLGFSGGFNYKSEDPSAALKRLAPGGIDIYYENVGGEQLQAAVDHMRDFGRIVACGMISQYNTPAAQQFRLGSLTQIVQKRLTIRGFVVRDPDMGPKYREEHARNLARWIREGKVKARSSTTAGIDAAGEGFVGMLRGENFGKAVLDVSVVERGGGGGKL
ncbi:MAG: hypothetical protein M1828_003491 [Chrysothrix sp. TS-e1954]|nr:MAG: hypothetical protein M1828_003491 [Chrysothrix sp. TS-e1954]